MRTRCGIYKHGGLAQHNWDMTHVWSNGQWLETAKILVSAGDRGLGLGLGLFETLLVSDGEPVFAERHLARLHAACLRLGWHPEFPCFPDLMRELVQRNDLRRGRARIRLALTGGSGPLDDLALGADYRIWMTAARALAPPATTSACLSPWIKNERSPLAGLKCASYAENLLAMDHAARLGFEETVFLNTAGHLCEAAASNLFLVKNGHLFTPSLASGCLPGITRAVVIELAGTLGISCSEADLSEKDLESADELLLTSSIRGLVGVSRFEKRIFPPGDITHALRGAWDAAVHCRP